MRKCMFCEKDMTIEQFKRTGYLCYNCTKKKAENQIKELEQVSEQFQEKKVNYEGDGRIVRCKKCGKKIRTRIVLGGVDCSCGNRVMILSAP